MLQPLPSNSATQHESVFVTDVRPLKGSVSQEGVKWVRRVRVLSRGVLRRYPNIDMYEHTKGCVKGMLESFGDRLMV